MRSTNRRRALVIGGSISGLFAALLLRQVGWTVDVYERAGKLTGRGAGITTHERTRAALCGAGFDPGAELGVEVAGRRVLDIAGRILGERALRQTMTSWDLLYRLLCDAFPVQHHHSGKDLRHIDRSSSGVVVYFADGNRAEGDLLVGADGFRSTVRAAILPDVVPIYAGYVAWRGLVDEKTLSAKAHADLFGVMAFGLPPREQFISYPIAGPDNDLRSGHRRCNFVWYRPVEEATELRELLTDAKGRNFVLGIPPPLVRSDLIASLRRASRMLLAPQFNELVQLTPQPFLQPIYDVECPRMADGRVVIIGDAAFQARPHVASGVTKAAEDAIALAGALQDHRDVAEALLAFERVRVPANRRIVARARELGACLQSHHATPADRYEAERHHKPQAVLDEVAVYDFDEGARHARARP